MATVEELLRGSLQNIYQDSVDTLNTLISLTDQHDILNIKSQVDYLKSNKFIKSNYNFYIHPYEDFEVIDFTPSKVEAVDYHNKRMYTVSEHLNNNKLFHLDLVDLDTRTVKRLRDKVFSQNYYTADNICRPIGIHITKDNNIYILTSIYNSEYIKDIVRVDFQGVKLGSSTSYRCRLLSSYYDEINNNIVTLEVDTQNYPEDIKVVSYNCNTDTSSVQYTIAKGYKNADIDFEKFIYKIISEDKAIVTCPIDSSTDDAFYLCDLRTKTSIRIHTDDNILSEKNTLHASAKITITASESKIIGYNGRIYILYFSEIEPTGHSSGIQSKANLNLAEYEVRGNTISQNYNIIMHKFPCNNIYIKYKEANIGLTPISSPNKSKKSFHISARVSPGLGTPLANFVCGCDFVLELK